MLLSAKRTYGVGERGYLFIRVAKMTISLMSGVGDSEMKGEFMKLCEGCIKQDVCKFKEEVEEYEVKRTDIPEPLVPILSCKFRKPETYLSAPCVTVSCPSVWTDGTNWDSGQWSYTTGSDRLGMGLR